jgi:hypothetical protein
MPTHKIEGETLFLTEAPDEVGRPQWRRKGELFFDAILARAFFYKTPDSGDNVEPVPLMVEIDAKRKKWIRERIVQNYVLGAEQIVEVDKVEREPFADAVIQRLLNDLLADSDKE